MPRIPNRDKSVPQYATRNASGRHMRTLTISCGGGLELLSSAHSTSPVCRTIWIRSVDARCVASKSHPITSETTAATPRAMTMTTTRAPTVTTSASVQSDAANVLDFPAVEYALLHPDDRVYPSSHSCACTQTTYRHVFCCEITSSISHRTRPNILYHQVHHITHRFMPIIVVS